MDLSFDEIVLKTEELELLKKLYHKNNWVHESQLPKDLDPTQLIELNLVEERIFKEDVFYLITNVGERYWLFINSKTRKFFWCEVRNWITAIIAVAAFVKSFFF